MQWGACWFQTSSYYTTTYIHTYTRLTALCPGLPRWAGTRKVKPIWISLKQEIVSGSGISWAVCKSAPRSRQITTPAPHHSVFYRPDALPFTILLYIYKLLLIFIMYSTNVPSVLWRCWLGGRNGIRPVKNKKLSYRRGTARCVVLIEILPIVTQQCRNYLYDKSWPNRWYEVGDLVGGNAW